jgi:tRNA-splicing ligase RtcB
MVKIEKINEYEWLIKKSGRMKADVRIFADEKLLEKMKEDRTLIQASNMASLMGVINPVVVCPDAHEGYGACIGGVSAMNIEEGVVSPGEIGYDLNCSVRLLRTNLKVSDLEDKKKRKEIIQKLFRDVPSGVGEEGRIKLSKEELDEVLVNGAQWAVSKGYGKKEDYENTEDKGKIENANPKDVSERARARGKNQLGSLGAGNHFLEIQRVEEIYDTINAKKMGLEKGMITIMIHCGSRGLGHQVASDYIKLMEQKYGWPEFDRELVNAPITSELGKKYLSAMACAANFAFANKQLITHWVRDTLKRIFPKFSAEVVYDVCHNIAKFEKHNVEDEKGNKIKKEILVMRKGATRAFPEQPIILPGSMGTSSYVLIGNKIAEEKSFSSTAHGAGRVESRTQAKRELNALEIEKQLNEKGIEIVAGSNKGIVEEAPEVYKDIDEVVRVSDKVGLGKLVAKVIPLAVMKG